MDASPCSPCLCVYYCHTGRRHPDQWTQLRFLYRDGNRLSLDHDKHEIRQAHPLGRSDAFLGGTRGVFRGVYKKVFSGKLRAKAFCSFDDISIRKRRKRFCFFHVLYGRDVRNLEIVFLLNMQNGFMEETETRCLRRHNSLSNI